MSKKSGKGKSRKQIIEGDGWVVNGNIAGSDGLILSIRKTLPPSELEKCDRCGGRAYEYVGECFFDKGVMGFKHPGEEGYFCDTLICRECWEKTVEEMSVKCGWDKQHM